MTSPYKVTPLLPNVWRFVVVRGARSVQIKQQIGYNSKKVGKHLKRKCVTTRSLTKSSLKNNYATVLNVVDCQNSSQNFTQRRQFSNFYHGPEYGRHNFLQDEQINDETATKILRKHELSVVIKEDFDNKNINPVLSFESNILPSNSPLEDRRAQAKFHHNTDLSMLFGVFDGHGGEQCANAVSLRLFQYMALALLPQKDLKSTLQDVEGGKSWPALLEWLVRFIFYYLIDVYCVLLMTDLEDFQNGCDEGFHALFKTVRFVFRYQHSTLPPGVALRPHQDARLRRFMAKRLNNEIIINSVEDAMLHACHALDTDILKDAQNQTVFKSRKHASPDLAAIDTAMSGCVACFAHVSQDRVTVGNLGDSHAVLGTRDLLVPGRWIATPLSRKHNAQNDEERRRILSEHPESEKDALIRNDRLLGSLAPFRAFGNARFKWPVDVINEVSLLSLDGDEDIGVGGDYRIPDQANWLLPFYRTPPYLSSVPDVITHQLQPNDAFLVIGTDGLWETMHKRRVIQIIGEHIDRSEGRADIKDSHMFSESDILDSDVALFGLEDTNSATNIIRHCIGQTFDGPSRRQVRSMLSLTQEESRFYRDDITVTVIKFNPFVL